MSQGAGVREPAAADLLTIAGEFILAQAALEEGARIDAGRGMGLEERRDPPQSLRRRRERNG